jgi:copper(I)-binding protein
MSRYSSILLLLFTLMMVAAQCASNIAAPTPAAKGVVITNAEARVAGANGVVYLDVLNNTDQADALVKAETDVATAELHETTIDANQVMHMEPTPKVALPVGETINFKPGGKHIMLIGLKKELAPGDKIKVTLTFEHAPPMPLEITIASGPTGHDHGMEHEMNGEHDMDMSK